MTTQVRRRVSSPLHNFNFHVSEVGHQDLSAMWYFCGVFGRIWHSPFILLYLLAFWVAPAFLHPQCLDFKPPFQPQQELQFCQMYKYFGCCDYARDQELMAKYYRIMDNFDYYGYSNCAAYVQDLLCQVSLVCWHNYETIFLFSLFLCKCTRTIAWLPFNTYRNLQP